MIQAEIDDFIGIFKNIYNRDECERVIQTFETALLVNRVDLQNRRDTVLALNAHNFDAYFKIFMPFAEKFWEYCYKPYAEKFYELNTFDIHKIYIWNIQRTVKGEGYHEWHCEQGSRDVSNRILVFQIYLNDVIEGGETEFLYQHKRIKPEVGKVIVYPANFTHTHRGNPPLSNTKYMITGWIDL